MKKILVPCDCAPCAAEALRIVSDFAQLTDSEIVAIYGFICRRSLPRAYLKKPCADEEFVNNGERDAVNQFRKLRV